MKLLLLLLIPCMMKGQDTTTANRSGYLYLSSGEAISNYSTAWDIGKKILTGENDTVRVVMLVCDTSYNPLSTMTVYINTELGIPGYMDGRNNFVWWQFGYEVRTYLHKFGNIEYYNGIPEHVTYLDDKRNPPPPSIIVWMSREIK